MVTGGDRDVGRLFAAQGTRAFAYGLTVVLLGTQLEAQGWSSGQAGILFGAMLVGAVGASVAIGRYADLLGRRRCSAVLYVLLAFSGFVYATTDNALLLGAVALTGVLSTDVIESGPFTSLEQSMLASKWSSSRRARGYGRYNAIAAIAGSAGALVGGLPSWFAERVAWAPAPGRAFLILSAAGLVGLAAVQRLSRDVEARSRAITPPTGTTGSPAIKRLAALFALDSFAGGFVAQSYLAYYLADRFGASDATIGATFAALGLLAALSFVVAPRIAEHLGLLQTMVATHIPSSLFLAGVVVAPALPAAIGCLIGRALLSQMDVPTRQAFVVSLVDDKDHTPAIATTNTARYITRPFGALAGGFSAGIAAGAPLVAAATLKITYDVTLWRSFRPVPALPEASR